MGYASSTHNNQPAMRATASDPAFLRRSRAPTLALGRLALPSIFSGPEALLAIALLLLSVALLTVLPALFNVDTWLELTAGRLIWQGGIPHTESLTAIAHGRPWIDQQWLAQLLSYGLWRLGGLGLLGVTNVALVVCGLAMAVAGARTLGASVRSILVSIVVCGWLLLPATEVRTQQFALPLFAATLYLLARDSRQASWRVYAVLPILVLWANLHGSASLGAGLVALRGATIVWEERRHLLAQPRQMAKALGLILGAPASLLLTPYGLRTLDYYRVTLTSTAFRHAVTEWQPVTSSMLVAVPFFCVAALLLWSFGRAPERTTSWERLALLALAAMTISVIRNVAFFALAALILAPVSLTTPQSHRPGSPGARQRRINSGAVLAALTVTLTAVGVALDRSSAQLEARAPKAGMLKAIEHVTRAQPAIKLAADTRFADWLLWRAPELAGRLAADARFELYTPREMYALVDLFAASGADWSQAAAGDRLLVLDRSANAGAIVLFQHEPGARTIYSDANTIVILRPPPGRT